jgi:hypothetical protein
MSSYSAMQSINTPEGYLKQKLNILMTLFNYLFNNNLLFYRIFAGTGGIWRYSLITSYLDSFYVDKNVQIDAW